MPEVDVAEENLWRLASIMERQLEDITTPDTDARMFRKALDAYVDFRIGWILSQTVLNGAQLIKIGECPSP